MSRHARAGVLSRLARKFRGRSTVLNPAHCCGLGPDGTPARPPVRYERFPLPPGLGGIDTALYLPVTREEIR